MRRSITRHRWKVALLLDALVLPGSGHFLAGYRILGSVMAILTLAFLMISLAAYSSSYIQIIQLMPASAGFAERAVQASATALGQGMDTIRPCAYSILFLWLFGIVDMVLRIRREIDGGIEEESI